MPQSRRDKKKSGVKKKERKKKRFKGLKTTREISKKKELGTLVYKQIHSLPPQAFKRAGFLVLKRLEALPLVVSRQKPLEGKVCVDHMW